MGSLLPEIFSPAEYRTLRGEATNWLPAATAVCQRHGLDPARLQKQGTGTHIVFRTGSHIVKLYAPFWSEDHRAERAALRPLRGPLTPELVADGELEGWPYLVMTVVPGIPAEEAWNSLTEGARVDVGRQLGELMRELHDCDPVPELATDWEAFVAERIAAAERFHDADEPWRTWMRERLAGFSEPAFTPVLLHADITADHALLSPVDGNWRITGLIDFGDAMMGHPFYDFIAPLAFYGFGQPEISRAIVAGYGLSFSADLAERLTTYCLLHKYGRIGVFLSRHPAVDGAAFHRALWG